MIGWEVRDGIGVLTLANPPLNLVTLEQTQRLHQTLDMAAATMTSTLRTARVRPIAMATPRWSRP